MPRTFSAGKCYPLNMRTTREIREKLESAAKASGRSLVQEVEFRLMLSFERDQVEKQRAEDFLSELEAENEGLTFDFHIREMTRLQESAEKLGHDEVVDFCREQVIKLHRLKAESALIRKKAIG